MKYFFTIIFFAVISQGCKQRIISGAELENQLKETMREYLDTTLQQGTKVTIKDVIYYPEKSKGYYICEFHVNMRLGRSDTTGVVAATITNDFKKVTRTR